MTGVESTTLTYAKSHQQTTDSGSGSDFPTPEPAAADDVVYTGNRQSSAAL